VNGLNKLPLTKKMGFYDAGRHIFLNPADLGPESQYNPQISFPKVDKISQKGIVTWACAG
jgi:hypothetical protein